MRAAKLVHPPHTVAMEADSLLVVEAIGSNRVPYGVDRPVMQFPQRSELVIEVGALCFRPDYFQPGALSCSL